MRGFSKDFATKQDVFNYLELYPKETKEQIRSLIASRFMWVVEKELADDEPGINDDTHIVGFVASESNPEKRTKVQYVQQEDPNAYLFKLGFTVKEAQALLA